MTNYEALKAYIKRASSFAPKNAPLSAKYILNWAKYVRRTIKERTCEEWKHEMFETLMNERCLDEHTGGRKRKEI